MSTQKVTLRIPWELDKIVVQFLVSCEDVPLKDIFLENQRLQEMKL